MTSAHRIATVLAADVVDHSAGIVAGQPGTLGRAANPRTTSVALRDGGHWLVVGGQVARDEAGNVVGKGDMRAQIEQVGKNVDACLKAGGATVNDIIFMVNQVTAPTEFDKYPRPARALLPPTFAEEHDNTRAAIVQPGLVVAGRGVRCDQVRAELRLDGRQTPKHPAQGRGYEVQLPPVRGRRLRRRRPSARNAAIR